MAASDNLSAALVNLETVSGNLIASIGNFVAAAPAETMIQGAADKVNSIAVTLNAEIDKLKLGV